MSSLVSAPVRKRLLAGRMTATEYVHRRLTSEAEAIETRYAKLNDRTFPVAVIFLVPASAVQGGAA